MLKNVIGSEQAKALINIKHEKKMITLCGLTGKEKELDFSNQGLNAADAMFIADDIQDIGALSKLDISYNHIPDSQQAELRRICSAKSIDCQL